MGRGKRIHLVDEEIPMDVRRSAHKAVAEEDREVALAQQSSCGSQQHTGSTSILSARQESDERERSARRRRKSESEAVRTMRCEALHLFDRGFLAVLAESLQRSANDAL